MKPYTHMQGLNVAVLATYKTESENQPGTVEIDCSKIERYADYLSSNGARGVFVCGTTGDFSVLSVGERLRIQEAWLTPSVTDKFEHVIVHIGSPVWEDLVALGTHATERGASAVAVTFPSFPHHSPQTPQHMLQYLVRVSHALPNTPLMLYNIQGATNPQFFNDLHPILKEVKAQIPNFVGVKYTSTNFIDAFEIFTQLKLDVGIGNDEKIFAACAMGFKHFICATGNLFCQKHCELLSLFSSGEINEAQELARRLFDATRMISSEGYLKLTLRTATNRIMKLKYGLDLGPVNFPFLVQEDYQLAEKLTECLFKEFGDLL